MRSSRFVRGRFTSFSGTVVIDPPHAEATHVDVDIDASSVDTAMAVHDAHLRGEEFFDVERHPTITFRSRGATVLATGRYTVRGELTIRGIAQPVRLDVDLFGRAPDVLGNPRLGLKATAEVCDAPCGASTGTLRSRAGASPWPRKSGISNSTCRW